MMPAVIGFDTETNQGPPITVQFYSEDVPRVTDCLFVTPTNVLDKTLRHLAKHCKHGEFVIYGHHLGFDLPSMFFSRYADLIQTKSGEFEFSHRDWEISGVFGTPTFCYLRNRYATITIVDTMSWFATSLSKVAELVCPDLPKLEMPEGLGTRDYTRKDRTFMAYAMRDAEVAYHAGKAIDRMHLDFELPQCVSVANMASKIFCQHYISEVEPIWNTGREINAGAVASYHGGKNNVRPGASPMWHEPVDAWDLSSAYPHAMMDMPAFSLPRLFGIQQVFSKRAQSFPDHGVYCVSGKVAPCDWPIFFDDDFKPVRGAFENIWVTGYELNEARRSDEVTLSRVWGHIYRTEQDPVTSTATQRYVSDFYEKKQTATDPVYRFMYKILLNALYGKFIQSREMESANGEMRWKHGPLYHPFMASLITGHTRAVMHRLEHETEALHTATDGVFCPAHKSPKDGVFDWAPQEGLGAIENEGYGLELCILRNKLYLAYSDEPGEGRPSEVFPGKQLVKFAKHGYQGSLADLERAAAFDERTYRVEKANTLKTSVNRGLVPNKFEVHERALNLGPIQGRVNHAN